MPNDNRISAAIASADKAAILTKIQEISALLPFLANLTGSESHGLSSIGTARAGMDDAFLQAMTAHPELVPGFVSMNETNKDRALRRDLSDIFQPLTELHQAISDTDTLASHDSYVTYLSFYNNAKEAARRGVLGADTIVANLQRFFPRGGRSNPPPPAPPNT